MTRPARSPGGYRRRVQISEYALHIVVEGKKNDKAYYGAIAEHSTIVRSKRYLITPVEVLKGTGGKKSVIEQFEYMKKTKQLVQEVSSGKRVTVFMVDRDAERVLGGSNPHPHLMYTNGYDVESDIIRNGDDSKALASALGLAPNEARSLAISLMGWANDAADLWREWITLCCISHKLGTSCGVTFNRPSQVNNSIVEEINQKRLKEMRSELEGNSGLNSTDFAQIESGIRRRIDRIYRSGRGQQLVKGKWLPKYLVHRIRLSTINGQRPEVGPIENQLVGNYIGSLDPSRSWAKIYLDRYESLLL